MTRPLSRRALLKRGLASGCFLFPDLGIASWSFVVSEQGKNSLRGATLLGIVPFINESSAPLDTVIGSELDGRLFTDLSSLSPQKPTIPNVNFYIRTRASELLPDFSTWKVTINGLVEHPQALETDQLKKLSTPMGLHVMECAGNVRLTHFGLISTGSWTGVPLAEILKNAIPLPAGVRVLVTGFDQYARESQTSIAGASWIFSLEELHAAKAFLATGLNGQPLTRDHGAPVRLIVPGWYGCACIKWVTGITLVEDGAAATSQMQEYAARTMQNGVPKLAREFKPAVIEPAAVPTRIEQWRHGGKLKYRVLGLAWSGSEPIKTLQIRFNPEEDYVPVGNLHQSQNSPWTFWTHDWYPNTAGTYTIRLSAKDSSVPTRRLDSGYYARTLEITEV
jgi:DMSO/TMAO reductase YedYZ molybdopterin-dependent catalytic subunit